MATLVLAKSRFGFVPTTYSNGAIRVEIYSVDGQDRTLLTQVDLPTNEPVTSDTSPAFDIRLISLSETR